MDDNIHGEQNSVSQNLYDRKVREVRKDSGQSMIKYLAFLAAVITLVTFLAGRDTILDLFKYGLARSSDAEARNEIFQNRYGSPESLLAQLRNAEEYIRMLEQEKLRLQSEHDALYRIRPHDSDEYRLRRQESEDIQRNIQQLRSEILLKKSEYTDLRKDYDEWRWCLKRLGSR